MSKTIIRKALLFILVVITLITTPTRVYAEPITPTGIPILKVGNHVDDLVAHHMRESSISPGVAVAIVKDGEIVFMQGYGYANIEQVIPIDPATTIFAHASVNKLFVYVSIMQLVEQGLLDLDNDINEYLPEDIARQFNFQYNFTVRDLLNHSAGFGEVTFDGTQDAENVRLRRTLREGLLITQPMQIFEPSTAKAYSNFGIALAAYIVSHISGMEYADYERTNIFELLGMTNTRSQPHWYGDSSFQQNRARTYQPDGNGGYNRFHWSYLATYPQGGSIGTVVDLAKFAISLMPEQGEASPLFYSRSTLDLMFSPSYDNPNVLRGTHHGFLTHAAGSYTSFAHGGTLAGSTAVLEILPSQRYGVVLLSNGRTALGGNDLISDLLDLIMGYSFAVDLPIVEGLPNAASVAGSFIQLRRREGTIIEAANTLYSYWRINAIDENTITFVWAAPFGMSTGIEITYQQIAPYVFRAISATDEAMHLVRGMYELHFIMENGNPVRISTSWVTDATIQTFGQSITAFMSGFAIIIVSSIFFLVLSIVVFIGFLRRKKKNANIFTHLSNGLLACGLLYAVNFVAFELRYAAVSVAFLFPPNFATPHIWINLILLAVSVVVFVASIIFWKRDAVTTKCRVRYVSIIVLLIMHTLVLWQWNYFAIQ